MLMNGENCTDHTDYTDADERRELYGSHGKTRMLMNKDSVRSVESVQNKSAHGTHISDRRRANRKHTN